MNKTDIINTNSGKVEGYREKDLEIFKGIPFAEPPIGDLRFMAPVAKTPWGGLLNATEYGPCGFQGYSILEKYFGKLKPESEDCLNLNIWTPKADDKKRPVMVWFHGGAFIFGGGKNPLYDGSILAQRGDVVVITINYRLGAFGFLYIPEVTINAGILDQALALKWIHDNIASFGGDPNNITIFGESAGAYSVVTLPVMPAAKGLFKRVIAESAPFIDARTSNKISKNLMRGLKIKKGDIDALRKIPPEKIIEVQNKITANDLLAFRPMIDGKTIPIHPLKAFKNGECQDIDFMIGSNLEEAKLFTALDPSMMNLSEEEWEKRIFGFLALMGIKADKSKEMVETYRMAREGIYSTANKEIANAIITDMMFRISTIDLLEARSKHQINNYNYMFTWPSPGFGGNLGACHAVEIPFVFNRFDIPGMDQFCGTGPEARALGEKIIDAWISFARTGNPNHEGLPDWPAYDIETRATMSLGKECKIINAAFDKEREVWQGILNV